MGSKERSPQHPASPAGGEVAGDVGAAPPAGKAAPETAPVGVVPRPPDVAPFLTKVYDMVSDPATDAVISWAAGGGSFVIWDSHAFERDLLPRHFKHNHFTSFIRQLNTYGFHKVDPDRWEWANEGFVKGQKHLLKTIKRKKKSAQDAPSDLQPAPVKTAPGTENIEIGKYGGLEKEVETLKRDKALLMQQLVDLRQYQQSSSLEVQNLIQRLHVMEQNQQQMMALLAIVVQNPNFLNQLVQQQRRGNWWNDDGSRKRRFRALEQGPVADQEPSGAGATSHPGTVRSYLRRRCGGQRRTARSSRCRSTTGQRRGSNQRAPRRGGGEEDRMGRDGGGVARPGAGRSCELCGAPATVHCAADAAFLCAACDAKVHGANFLASRHRRTRLVPAAAAGCQAASASEDGYASAASSCVSTADSAAAARRSRGGRARAGGSQQATRGAAARRRAEVVLEGWAKRMGLAPVAARRRAAAAWRALRAGGADARVPPRVAMAGALWLEVETAAAGGGACHGDALRRLEACAHVPARLVAAVATSLARARARRRAEAADAAAEGWDECAWAGPKSSPARS